MNDNLSNGFRLTDDPVDPVIYLNLKEDCFQIKFAEEQFYWYHYQAPWGRSRFYTAWMDNRLVSSVAFLPLRLIYHGKERAGSIYVNAMTHPEFQKMGLNVALLEMAAADAKRRHEAYSITFPTTIRHSVKGMLKAGWSHHENLFYWELLRIPREGKVFATQVPAFNLNVQPLLEKLNKSVRLGVAKTFEFLNWRAAHRPDVKYELYQYGLHNQILGILIIKHYHTDKEKKTHIMEIIADDDNSLELLLQAAEARAAAAGSSCLNLWVSDYEINRSQISDYGFIPSSEKNILFTRSYDDSLVLDSSLHDHFALLDNDTY